MPRSLPTSDGILFRTELPKDQWAETQESLQGLKKLQVRGALKSGLMRELGGSMSEAYVSGEVSMVTIGQNLAKHHYDITGRFVTLWWKHGYQLWQCTAP